MNVSPVSVIVPTFNAAAYVGQAIESAIAQSAPPRQIIVIDDGSTDQTEMRVRQYGDRVEYHRQENQGVSAARNRGVAAAREPFIAFLDADDFWHPLKLQLQMAVFATAPELALLGTQSFCWPRRFLPNADVQAQVRRISWRQLAVKNHLVTSSVVARREAIAKAGQFDTALQGPEDRDLWLRVAERGAIGALESPLTGYRQIEGSVSRNCDRCYVSMKRIIQKLDERNAWEGNWLLRRKAMAYLEHSAAWIYGAAGQRPRAVRMTLKSMALYPLAYSRDEVGTAFERPKRLIVNLLRILGIKSTDENRHHAVP